MIKIFKLKKNDQWIRAIFISRDPMSTEEEPKIVLTPVYTDNEDDAAWYMEDKSLVYQKEFGVELVFVKEVEPRVGRVHV